MAMVLLACALALGMRQVTLDTVLPESAQQDWGSLRFGCSVQGHPLKIGGRTFTHGLGTHAKSRIEYALNGAYTRFDVWVGIDDEMDYRPMASVVFRVLGDGKLLFDSGICRPKEAPREARIDVHQVKRLVLLVDDAGDGIDSDHADWADAALIGNGSPAFVAQPRYRVTGRRLRVGIDASGHIARIEVPNSPFVRPAWSQSRVGDLTEIRPARVTDRHGRLTVKRLFQKGLSMEETFAPRGDGVRWTLTISDDNPAWSAPVVSDLRVQLHPADRYWAAWGGGEEWSDPLVPQPPRVAIREYGAFFAREGGVSLPSHTLLAEKGLTMLQAIDDRVFAMSLGADSSGLLRFSRSHLRLGGGRIWTFHVDLIPHEPNVRSSLASIVATKPAWFEPPNPLAAEVGGAGAYSGFEGEIDRAKLHKMAFSFNWKASIDFPYMGMFLPPVERESRWNRFAGGGGGVYTAQDEGRFGSTSISQLDAYAKRMRDAGFHVLSYFNATEFGGNIVPFNQPISTEGSGPNWKDPNRFLRTNFPKAPVEAPSTIWTWGGAVVMDCGDPRYRSFLLEQATRHFKELPNADGICIDRLDWLDVYNKGANDGLAWDDGPCRSLIGSWMSLLSDLGPLAHSHDKLIFVNFMVRRPDLASQVDGVYDEFGDVPYDLNASNWCMLFKPLVCWTRDREQVLRGGDAFFQRYLYMGAFMTAPIPENDHTIRPDPAADRPYLDYGPLFSALKGRRWALRPRISQLRGEGKINEFDTPGGRVVVVAFAGNRPRATVEIPFARFRTKRIEGIVPGSNQWVELKWTAVHGAMRIESPLSRGAAVIRLREGK